MMIAKLWKVFLLVISFASICEMASCPSGEKWFNVQSNTIPQGMCSFGQIYKPIPNNYDEDVFNTALEEQGKLFDDITNWLQKGSDVPAKTFEGYDNFIHKLKRGDNGKKIIDSFRKIAPKLVSALGILGLGLNIFLSLGTTPEEELRNKVNNGFLKLDEKINTQKNDLKNYANYKVTISEKDGMMRRLKVLESNWANCFDTKQPNPKQYIVNCQVRVGELFRAESYEFMTYFDNVMNKEYQFSPAEIITLEVTQEPFRRFIISYTIVIQALILSEKGDAGETCTNEYKMWTRRFVNDMEVFKNYFDRTMEHITSVHTHSKNTEQTNCKETMKCKLTKTDLDQDKPVYYYDCSCIIDPVNPNAKCKIMHSKADTGYYSSKDGYVWACGKSVTSLFMKRSKDKLKLKADAYIKKFNADVVKFWKAKISYDKIIYMIKKAKEVDCDCNYCNVQLHYKNGSEQK